ncbi:MAG TPA: sensor histidine kinase [Jatrophihabitans sp.]|nr:sensor histidine kinase [Jatrophihabitans sp.]
MSEVSWAEPGSRPAGVGDDVRRALRGWRRLLFPAVFLAYLVQTAAGVVEHAHGAWVAVGMALLAAFCACYLLAVVAGQEGGGPRRFWGYYAATLLITAAETPFAHQDAFVMLVYVSVLTVAASWLAAIPVVLAYLLIAALVPAAVPGWHAAADWNTAIAVGFVSLAMYGFFAVVRANSALADARAEVARLATENERARIARDLHDLLGHSLTTITVKAALANRLAGTDPVRARAEIAEVETLTRRTLADVRAAVSGYREVTLANELAAAREVLRAAGIDAELPGAVDSVDGDDAELFGWVVREGVTNVVRHARASSCSVRLGPRSVEIADDGVGPAGSRAGNGLTGLRERVAAAGGRLSLEVPAAGRGSRLVVELPAGAEVTA